MSVWLYRFFSSFVIQRLKMLPVKTKEIHEKFKKNWENFSSIGSATAARISAVRQPFSPWGYHAGCHCSNKTVVLPPSSSSSSTKRFGFDRKRMLLPSRMSNEKPQRRTTAESRSQTAMSFASEPCW